MDHPVDAVRPEGTNVLFDTWLVSRAVTGMLDAGLAPSGLTADEFGIYSVLHSTDAMTPSELARWMSAPATTVSSTVKRLEARGHVVRERNPADGRSSILRLTPAGVKAWEAAGLRFLPLLAAVLDELDGKDAPIRKGLTSLRRAVDAVIEGQGEG